MILVCGAILFPTQYAVPMINPRTMTMMIVAIAPMMMIPFYFFKLLPGGFTPWTVIMISLTSRPYSDFTFWIAFSSLSAIWFPVFPS